MPRKSDEQWDLIQRHSLQEHCPDGRPGHRPIPACKVREAVLWILEIGAQWHALPQSRQTHFDSTWIHGRDFRWRDKDLRVTAGEAVYLARISHGLPGGV